MREAKDATRSKQLLTGCPEHASRTDGERASFAGLIILRGIVVEKKSHRHWNRFVDIIRGVEYINREG